MPYGITASCEIESQYRGYGYIDSFQRRILPKPLRGSKARPQKQKRPRSRTLTAVHEAWLDEIVFPAEVVGKRIRVKLDGKKIYKASRLDCTRDEWADRNHHTAPNGYCGPINRQK